jgi:hypothetical protein
MSLAIYNDALHDIHVGDHVVKSKQFIFVELELNRSFTITYNGNTVAEFCYTDEGLEQISGPEIICSKTYARDIGLSYNVSVDYYGVVDKLE